MKACDRHARAEGSLKPAPFRLVVFNDEANPMEDSRVLEQELCEVCCEDVIMWYRESIPATAFLRMLAPDGPEEVAR